MHATPRMWLVPAFAAAGGLAVMLAVTDGEAWPFVLGWVAACLAVAAIEARAGSKRLRVVVPALAIFVLPVLVFEGGFFLLPAALALLAVAALSPEPA